MGRGKNGERSCCKLELCTKKTILLRNPVPVNRAEEMVYQVVTGGAALQGRSNVVEGIGYQVVRTRLCFQD
jgi:hypothetical protein